MTHDAQEERKRVLILGSTAHPREVECYNWLEWDEPPNVADYNAVFLNLMGGLPAEGAPTAEELPRPDLFDDLLRSGGAVFVVGLESCPDATFAIDISNLLPCEVVLSPPSTVVTIRLSQRWQEEFERFFENVKAARRWLVRVNARADRWARAARDAGVELHSIAVDRANHILAWRVNASRGGLDLYFLPAPTECSAEEGINILLEDILEISSSARPPEWVQAHKAPGQEEKEALLAGAERKLADAQQAASEAREVLSEVQRYRELLYGISTQLEDIVHRTLKDLGAEVETEQPGKHDGRIVDPSGRKAVLEIKGTTRTISLQHQRQLADWVAREVGAQSGFDKGILFGNPYCNLALEERTDPAFAREAVANAQRDGQALVTTRDLFFALKKVQAGELARGEFWDAIFKGRGEVDFG